MMGDILVDWLYLLMTAFGTVVCIYVLHLICFEIDFLAPIVYCVSLIETYWWTSLFSVCFLALLVIDRHQNMQKHRYYVERSHYLSHGEDMNSLHDYDDSFYYTGQNRLRARTTSYRRP